MTVSFISHITDFKLELRDTHFTNALLLVSLLCTALIGISQLRTVDLFRNVTRNFFKIEQREKEFGDTGRIAASSSFLLFVNFFLAFSMSSFLFFSKYLGANLGIILALSTTLVFIFLQQLGFRIASWISGERGNIDPVIQLTRQTWQFGGLLFLMLAVVWVLNRSNSQVYEIIYYTLVGILLLFRILKSISFSINHRISWYYFILYLCTLEILPLAVLMKLVVDYSGVKF